MPQEKQPNEPASELKSEAYLVYAEWGPALRIPRDKRLAACYPTINEQDRNMWIQEFKKVKSKIWEIAEEGGPSRHTREVFDVRMSGHFSWMSKAALDKAWFLTCYFAWHEGWLKTNKSSGVERM
jgi:hypothetical protein